MQITLGINTDAKLLFVLVTQNLRNKISMLFHQPAFKRNLIMQTNMQITQLQNCATEPNLYGFPS